MASKSVTRRAAAQSRSDNARLRATLASLASYRGEQEAARQMALIARAALEGCGTRAGLPAGVEPEPHCGPALALVLEAIALLEELVDDGTLAEGSPGEAALEDYLRSAEGMLTRQPLEPGDDDYEPPDSPRAALRLVRS